MKSKDLLIQKEQVETYLNNQLYSYLNRHPNCTIQDIEEALSERRSKFSSSIIFEQFGVKIDYVKKIKSEWKSVWFGFFKKLTPSYTEVLAKKTLEEKESLKNLSRINREPL